MIFQEGGFSFEFPDSWTIVKFDEHRFYKYLSGDGFKGVDFLCLSPEGALHFLEIKNYSNQFPKDGVHPLDDVFLRPEYYVDVYWKKYLDSKHLINLIYRYYKRKRWFRWFTSSKLLLNIVSCKYDWRLWYELHQRIISDTNTIHFEMWFALDEQEKIKTTALLQKMKKGLKELSKAKKTEVDLLQGESNAYFVVRPFQE